MEGSSPPSRTKIMKMYGPYLRKDGRKHVVIIHDNGISQTRSYPRLLLEQKLGRPLQDDETVDHIDGDFTNDSPENLRVLSRSENAAHGWVTGNSKGSARSVEFCENQRLLKSGSNNGMSKLKDDQILDLRSRKRFHGCITQWSLDFDVTIKTIRDILNNKTYKNI